MHVEDPVEKNRGDPVDRQEIHRVHEQHPYEHGKRRRGDEAMAVAMQENALDLLVHEIDRQLDEGLAAVGNAGRRAARHPPQQPERYHAEHD